MKKQTFALFFGNRGFFPGELIADARKEMIEAVTKNGFDYICMEESLTRYGAIETRQEGAMFAEFLNNNQGKFDGVIVCMPNFSDENGACVALKDVNLPILIQAYPDEIGKMDFAHRRDAFCGKFAMCNVLRQCGIKFTLTEKMVVSPVDPSFDKDLQRFGAICRVYKEMKSFNIGAFGARTTAFKTVRIDEIAMQNNKINVETFDMSLIFDLMEKVDTNKVEEKKNYLRTIANFGSYPDKKVETMAKLSIVMKDLVDEYNLQAIAVRCWDELEKKFGIAPCLVMSDFIENGIPAACELDVDNAIMMRALQIASNKPVMLMDVNNNYGTDENKTVLFHCSAVPTSFFKSKGNVQEHKMFKKSYGEGSGVGVLNGEIVTDEEVTISSLKTENGKLCSFVCEGKLTDDNIEKEFFGCGTVFETPNTKNLLQYMCENGFRHHVAIAHGNWADAVKEALEKYLSFNVDKI